PCCTIITATPKPAAQYDPQRLCVAVYIVRHRQTEAPHDRLEHRLARVFDIQEPDSATLIDWSQCLDAERVPDRCGRGWVVKGTRIPVRDILDNAEDCTPEQIAGPCIFPSLTVAQVRRVLRFAYQAQIDVLYEQRRLPLWPRDYELEGVILRHKL